MRLSIVRPTTPCTGLIGEVGGFDISINLIFPPHGAPPAIKSPVASRGHIGGGGVIDCHAFILFLQNMKYSKELIYYIISRMSIITQFFIERK